MTLLHNFFSCKLNFCSRLFYLSFSDNKNIRSHTYHKQYYARTHACTYLYIPFTPQCLIIIYFKYKCQIQIFGTTRKIQMSKLTIKCSLNKGFVVSALKKKDFVSKESRDFKKNLKLFVFAYYP